MPVKKKRAMARKMHSLMADSEAVDYTHEKAAERNGDSDATVVMDSPLVELEAALAKKNSTEFRPVPPPSATDTPKPTN